MILDEKYPKNKLILPFIYSETQYDSILDKLFKEKWSVDSPLNSNEFFSHVETLLDYENHQSIGCSFIKSFEKKPINLVKKEPQEVVASIKKLHLTLFKTGVGFLILSIETPKSFDSNALIDLNNRLHSLSHNNFQVNVIKDLSIDFQEDFILDHGSLSNGAFKAIDYTNQRKICYIKKDTFNNSKSVMDPKIIRTTSQGKIISYKSHSIIDLRDYLWYELREIKEISYFNQFHFDNGNKSMAAKLHIFVACLYNEPISDRSLVNNEAFLLSRGYKSSYKMNVSDDSSILSTFDNSIWAISREGISNLIWPVADKTTNAFFKSTYLERLNNYLFLYILALHQYYSLIKVSYDISTLPNSSRDYIEDDSNYEKLIDIYDNVNYIYLKCVFREVSHITHQAGVYDKIYKSLGMDTLLNEINYEMDRLTGLVNQIRDSQNLSRHLIEEKRYRQLKEDQEAKDRKVALEKELRSKREKKYAIIGSTFAFFSVFKTLWDIALIFEFRRIIGGSMDEKLINLGFVFSTMLLGIIVGFIVYLIWVSKDKKAE